MTNERTSEDATTGNNRAGGNDEYVLTPEEERSLARWALGAKTLEQLEAEGPVTEADHWLFPGFVSTSDTLLYGQSKVGKSFAVSQLVASLVDGRRFLGREPLSSGHRVVVVGLDGGAVHEYQQRLSGLGVPGADVEIVPANGAVDAEFWSDLQDLVQVVEATVVVFDHATGGIEGEFNSVDGWKDLWGNLKSFGPGVARILVAHATDSKFEGKTIHRPAGSFNATAAARARVYIHAPGGHDNPMREIRLLSNTRKSETVKCTQSDGGYFMVDGASDAPPDPAQNRSERTYDVKEEMIRLALTAPTVGNQTEALEWISQQPSVRTSDGEPYSPETIRKRIQNHTAWDRSAKRYTLI